MREDTRVENLGLLLSKTAQLLPAILTINLKASEIKTDNLTSIEITDLVSFFEQEPISREIISARLPTKTAEFGKLHVFSLNWMVQNITPWSLEK